MQKQELALWEQLKAEYIHPLILTASCTEPAALKEKKDIVSSKTFIENYARLRQAYKQEPETVLHCYIGIIINFLSIYGHQSVLNHHLEDFWTIFQWLVSHLRTMFAFIDRAQLVHVALHHFRLAMDCAYPRAEDVLESCAFIPFTDKVIMSIPPPFIPAVSYEILTATRVTFCIQQSLQVQKGLQIALQAVH